MSNTLYFEKISQFDREAEPVTVSIPFAEGKLTESKKLTIYDGDRPLPVQCRALAHWPDGSVKWALAHFQPDLPGNAEKTLHFEISDTAPPASANAVKVSQTPEGIAVDTGPLQFTISADGFAPVRDVILNGIKLWDSAFSGFNIRCGGVEVRTTGPVELEIEEAGPLRVVILIKGKHHREDGSPYLDMHGRVTAYAGKPYIAVEHQFIHAEKEEELSLESVTLNFAAEAEGHVQMALGQGYYRTDIQKSDGDPLEMTLDAETMLYQSNEHYIDSFYGDFWVDWCDDRGGLALSIHQAHQNFPKKLRVAPDGITCALYPDEVPPARMLQGMAKTHRIQLHFHAPDVPLEACSTQSLQFQLPDRPSLAREWFRENNPWAETFFPKVLPDRMLSYFIERHDARPKALGMFHFGDSPDAGYTNQGRGRGHAVWVNNEYDRPHNCALFYGLTGIRRALDSALVSARHWLDVDLCHYHLDPLINGGLRIHTAYHVTGYVTPSHEWTEGLLDYYFFTGRREGLVGARSVAENIMRHMHERPEMREPGSTSVREGGWALRAMVGMWMGTGEQKWKDEARRLVEMFLDWYDAYGALLAPYTSHSMPRVPFMIALTVNSFARYLLIEDDADIIERVKRLIVEVIDDTLEHCLGPDGVLFYKELPSLRRKAPTPHMLEALAHAYRITGDRKYMEMATRQFAAQDKSSGVTRRAKYLDDSGAVISGEGGARVFSSVYTSVLLYAAEAAPLGLLNWYEYPY